MWHPKPGQKVTIRHTVKKRPWVRFHDRSGVVLLVAAPRSKRAVVKGDKIRRVWSPKNALVVMSAGEKVVVPRGNLF